MRRLPRCWIGLLVLGVPLLTPFRAGAQTGGPYGLAWSVLGAGGLTASGGGGYEIGGTVGQFDPGVLAGGAFQLEGGFWNAGGAVLVGVGDDLLERPAAFHVLPNAPNPFSTLTSIAFELPTEQRVVMAVFDLNGDRVRQLLDQVMPAGRHQLVWAGIGDDGRQLPPGVYWIRTRAGSRSQVMKTVILR